MLDKEPQDDLLDELEPTEEAETDVAEAAEVDEETESADDAPADGDENSGVEDLDAAGLTITIEGEDQDEGEGPEQKTQGIRELRRAYRELSREKKELEQKLKANDAPEPVLGQKPTLEDFDYDADKFEAALLDWNQRKTELDQKAEAERQAQEDVQRRHQEKLAAYVANKVKIVADDFEDAEDAFKAGLSDQKQGLVVYLAQNPEHIVYALGARPKLLEKFSKLDPTQFVYELGKLEKSMTITSKPKPGPERRLSGSSGGVPGTQSKKLEQLEAKAKETGDYTALFAARRAQKK